MQKSTGYVVWMRFINNFHLLKNFRNFHNTVMEHQYFKISEEKQKKKKKKKKKNKKKILIKGFQKSRLL